MLRTSMPDAPSATPVEGATEVVEALTAEAAIEQVHARLGPGARILDARRVLRGGVGGFFSKEHVQLHAAPGIAPLVDVGAAPSGTPAADSGAPAVGSGSRAASFASPVTSPVDRLLDGAADAPDEVDFATYLRTQLRPGGSPPVDAVSLGALATPPVATWAPPAAPVGAPTPPVTVAPPPPTPASPTPVTPPAAEMLRAGAVAASSCEPTPATDGGPAWSVAALLRLGLPAELVRGLEVASPHDDLAWTVALAEAVRPLCRPLPVGPCVLVGREAHRLADVTEAPSARSRAWLDALGPGRWRHVVLGGDDRWRDVLVDDPLAVSWTRPESLPDALRCAAELGLVLGFGPRGETFGRARPLDVALAVRDLVGER